MEETENLIPTLFITHRQLNFGDSLYLTGSHPTLGKWNFQNSIEMRYGFENIWSTIVLLPINSKIEFKFIQSKSFKSDPQTLKWDETPNYQLTVTGPKPNSDLLTIISFNIRYENEIDGENSWTLRKKLALSIIQSELPDLLGTQESRLSQTNYLKENLAKNYGCYGRGRDYEDGGEAMTIYYRKDRFELLDKGTFWLSEERYTPGSRLKKCDFPRICSWVKLFDFLSKKVVFYFNTHFELLNSDIRKRNAEILLEEIDKISKKGENVILSGDFNANEGEACIELIAKRLGDSCEKGGEYTFHNFWGFTCMIGKIDFIFFGKEFERKEFMNIKTSEKRNGSTRYPSDHYPIKAVLKYK